MQSETIVHEAANMFFRSKHPVIHTTLWIAVCVGVPGLPILVGVLAVLLQRSEFVPTRLFDGIELLLISIGMIATTFVDLSRTDIDWSSHQLFYFFVRLLLFTFGLVSVIFLTLIYLNNRVAPLGFRSDLSVLLAFGNFVLIASFTLTLQYFIGYNGGERLAEA